MGEFDLDSDVKNLIKKIKDISKHPFVIIIFAVFVLYLFYYLVSPYQQCLRYENNLHKSGYRSEEVRLQWEKRRCSHTTDW